MTEAALLDLVHFIVRVIEMIGVSVMVVGTVHTLARYVASLWRDSGGGVETLRAHLGRSILLGLEFLVAADIINTVAVEPTLSSLAVLAGIVLIRTFLSFALEVEIGGTWPWRRAAGREQKPSSSD